MRRSVVAVAAAAIAGAAGLSVVTRAGERPLQVVAAASTSSPGPPGTQTTISPTTSPAASPTPSPRSPAVTSLPPPSSTAELRTGAAGPDVARLQQRLVDLGFWPGSADGVYSAATAHAVVAFQKLAGLAPNGIVGAVTQAALDGAARVRPRGSEGHRLEIDLTHQVLIVADAGTAQAVLDISTGRVAGTTPVGRFSILRQVDGHDHSPLGILYRPKYFHRGVAIHGYPSVPPSPASHGCVRTINPAMDWLWSSGAAPIGTAVWVYR